MWKHIRIPPMLHVSRTLHLSRLHSHESTLGSCISHIFEGALSAVHGYIHRSGGKHPLATSKSRPLGCGAVMLWSYDLPARHTDMASPLSAPSALSPLWFPSSSHISCFCPEPPQPTVGLFRAVLQRPMPRSQAVARRT